jgi:hypothetical protein
MLLRKKIFYFLLPVFSLSSCGETHDIIRTSSKESHVPPAPDYSKEKYWAALPDKKDPADSVPGNQFKNNEATAAADVFFIHPTTFTYSLKNKFAWNADVNDDELNKKTDNTTILYQASVFNGACRVYAPRYRQAHFAVFFTKDTADARRALDTAYADVKKAFQFYLKNYNHGRPIIIASHSQGTVHAYRLLKDFFNDSTLEKKLIAAYLVGMPISADSLKMILPPCNSPDQTNCFCSWNTFEKNYYPPYYEKGLNCAVCTNPLSWRSDTAFCADTLNSGAVLYRFNQVLPQLCDAQVHDGMLWIEKPNFPGSFLIRSKIYHRGDYNLFYVNVRDNVEERVKSYLEEHSANE